MFIMPMSEVGFGAHYGVTDYQPAAALMFDGSADTLSRTFSDSDGTEFIFSVWVKRASFSDNDTIFSAGSSPNRDIYFFVSNKLYINLNDGSDAQLITSGVFRDPSAWTHILVSHHHGEGTASDRIKVYVNGVEPSLGTANYPSSSTYVGKFNENQVHYLGSNHGSGSENWFSGYMADPLFIDTKSIQEGDFAITDFGSLDSTTGIWMPKDVSGLSYSGNSFYLDLSNGADIGNDVSGNKNDFTPSSMGADNIAGGDGPINSDTKEITLYPSPEASRKNSNITLTNHNCTVNSGSATGYTVPLNIPLSSGRWQITATVDAIDTSNGGPGLGFAYTANYSNATNAAADPSNFFGMRIRGGPEIQCNNNSTSWNPDNSATLSTSHTLTLLIDIPAGKAWALQNGTVLQNSSQDSVGNPAVGTQTNPTFTFTADSSITIFMMATSSATITLNPTTVNGSYSGYSAITSTVTGTGNYCTLNPISRFGQSSSTSITLTNGNLTSAAGDTNNKSVMGTMCIPPSGKWYFEARVDAVGGSSGSHGMGIRKVWSYQSAGIGADSNARVYIGDGDKGNGSTTTYGASWSAGNTIGVAVDMDNGALYFAINNTWQASGVPTSGSSKTNAAYTDLVSTGFLWSPVHEPGNGTLTFNFGADGFTYTPPTDYKALATHNLPEPTVTDPSAYYNTILYNGSNDSPYSVTGVSDSSGATWTPDFVWLKQRTSSTRDHYVFDSVRGVEKAIHPSYNGAEDSTLEHGKLTAFANGGFTLADGSSSGVSVKENGGTFVAWCMKAGGAPSADNTGDRTPTNNSVMKGGVAQTASNYFESANIYPKRMSIADHGGFSIILYTANNTANQTIPHGLDREPEFILEKDLGRSQAWNTHTPLGLYYGPIHTSAPVASTRPFAAEPTSEASGDATNLITLWDGAGTNYTNDGSEDHILYCFAKTPGLIGIGIYTSNDSTDGPHVIVDDGASGFRPAFVMLKAIQGSQNWRIHDSARNGYNGSVEGLFANTNGTEDTEDVMDMTATGFKIRSANDNVNGGTAGTDKYVYIAFAEQPFGSNNRAR